MVGDKTAKLLNAWRSATRAANLTQDVADTTRGTLDHATEVVTALTESSDLADKAEMSARSVETTARQIYLDKVEEAEKK